MITKNQRLLNYEDLKEFKRCKGCRLIENRTGYCVIIDYNTIDDCPCGNCLVKITCMQQNTCNMRQEHKTKSLQSLMKPVEE